MGSVDTGLRFSWQLWPASRAQAAEAELPLACVFQPLRRAAGLRRVDYAPLRCRASGCVVSPFVGVDFRSKFWTCPFSLQRNAFPAHYAENISETNLPAELVSPILEYVYPGHQTQTFIFVVDLATPQEELEALKESLEKMIAVLPDDTQVGLVTFGTVCEVHVLGEGADGLNKTYAFRGLKEVTALPQAKLLARLGDCEATLRALVGKLKRDSWHVPRESRPRRCSGVALSLALLLARAGRILFFTSGPCTQGPGQVAALALTEPLRGWPELRAGAAPHAAAATAFYEGLAKRAVAASACIHILACSLDQVGLHEMQSLCGKTGGSVVMADSFSLNVFKDSLKAFFEVDESGWLPLAGDCRLSVATSGELKVCGVVGHCHSLGKKKAVVSEAGVGESGTNEWAIAGCDPHSSLAVYFEVAAAKAGFGYVQFQFLYTHASGQRRLRVVTAGHRFSESASVAALASGFDQECAAVVVARLAVLRTSTQLAVDVLRWLDRKLIRLVARFADYTKDDASSFHLGAAFASYPQFIYHLRRSPFLQTFNVSPDEAAYYRHVLLREDVPNSVVMIQPALLEYSFERTRPVLLDAASLKPDVILLLDSFFHVVLWSGAHVHSWRQLEYDKLPEYAHFRALLEAPEEDVKRVLRDRFPAPKFVQCHAGGSQARFLLAKVNPSANNADQTLNTDDVSLKVFMQHLIKIAVQS